MASTITELKCVAKSEELLMRKSCLKVPLVNFRFYKFSSSGIVFNKYFK